MATLGRACDLVLQSSLLTPTLTVLWHAGEPLAAGIQFFRAAVQLISDKNIHLKKINHSIQTNGTLINDNWSAFFKEHRFDVGVSLDGPEFLHNKHRIGWNGQGSFRATMKGVENLSKNGVKYSAICVLSDKSLDYPDEIFDFFVENKFTSIAFNVEEIEAAHSKSSLLNASEFEETRLRYVSFMERILNRWIQARGSIFIREFDHIIRKILARRDSLSYVPMLDVSQGLQIVTVRVDGGIVTFSPELASGTFLNPDEFVVGYVQDIDYLEDIFSNSKYVSIRNQIKSGIKKCEKECAYFGLCGGGWPSNKYAEHGTFDSTETKSCAIHTKALADVLIENLTTKKEFIEAISSMKSLPSSER